MCAAVPGRSRIHFTTRPRPRRARPFRASGQPLHGPACASLRVRPGAGREAFCRRPREGFAYCNARACACDASPCPAKPAHGGALARVLRHPCAAARRGSQSQGRHKTPRQVSTVAIPLLRWTSRQGRKLASDAPDPRPRRFCTRSNGVSAHDEAILVEVEARPARLAAQNPAGHVARPALAHVRVAQRSRALAVIRRFRAAGFRSSAGQQLAGRGMTPVPARVHRASTPPAGASQDPDPGYLPPPPRQPLPPAMQPTGPMPDQDHPPGEPHHLPDDPVAVPDEGGSSRRTAP